MLLLLHGVQDIKNQLFTTILGLVWYMSIWHVYSLMTIP